MVQSPAVPVVVVAAVVAAACGLKANMYRYQPPIFIYPANRKV
jgi:hypothetical protein